MGLKQQTPTKTISLPPSILFVSSSLVACFLDLLPPLCACFVGVTSPGRLDSFGPPLPGSWHALLLAPGGEGRAWAAGHGQPGGAETHGIRGGGLGGPLFFFLFVLFLVFFRCFELGNDIKSIISIFWWAEYD